MKPGDVLFNSKQHKITITKIENNILYVNEEYPVTITMHSGKFKENIIREQVEIYNIYDIGITLFFNESDFEKHKNLKIEDSRYYFNKDNIIQHFDEMYNKIINDIRKDAPYGKSISKNDKEKIILSYYDSKSRKNDDEHFFKKYPTSSCFGRIDLDTHFYRKFYEKYFDKHFYDKVYIGKGFYSDLGNGTHIVNWRSPIANMYYDSKTSNVTSDVYLDVINKTPDLNPHNIYEYELLLKRNFSSIRPLRFNDLYIAGNEFFSEGSYDPFLIEVLIEKRTSHEMSDIIKSIQSNQNTIIRETHNSNIIVQGCAGSGKTMILLHRLSYLKYNNLLPNSNSIKIITPNKYFSLFINELAISLELEHIERITMIDYLFNLCLRYQKEFPILEKKNSDGVLISKSEVNFNMEALNFLKDTNILCDNLAHEKDYNLIKEETKKFYDVFIDDFLSRLNIHALEKISQKTHVNFPSMQDVSDRDFFEKLSNILKDTFPRFQKTLLKQIEENENRIDFTNKNFNEFFSAQKNLQNQLQKIEEIILSLHQLENDIKNHFINNINTLKEEYKNLSFLNFSKKSALSREIQFLKRLSMDFHFDDLNSLNENILPNIVYLEFQDRLQNIFHNLKLFIDNLHNVENHNNISLNKEISKINKIFFSLYEKLKTEEHKISFSYIFNISIECKNNLISLDTLYNEVIVDMQQKLNSLIEETNISKEKLLTPEEKDIINNSVIILRSRGALPIEIFKQLNSDIDKLVYSKNHILQLLYIYTLYCGQLKAPEQMIFIDEGQDYSTFEYHLLKRVHGENIVFNIFGDIHQCINNLNGTMNWDSISIKSNMKKFEINENYRNTIEITKFVNDEFKTKMTPIGISGDNVEHISCSAIEDYIKKNIEKDKKTRIALIGKNKSAFSTILQKFKENDLFVGDVFESKGLEFDIVFVNNKDMSINEKYISYTRALNKLYIIT